MTFYGPMLEADYRAAEGVNQSSLKQILVSPAHYLKAITEKREPSPSMEFGTMADTLLLRGADYFGASYELTPDGYDGRTTAGKQWKAQLEASGKKALSGANWIRLEGMLREIRGHEAAQKHLIAGRSQIAGFAELDFGGEDPIQCKCLTDHEPLYYPARLVDYKTSQSARPHDFANTIKAYGYHIQAAFYIDIAKANGIDRPDWVWIVQETEAPYGVMVYKASAELIDTGRFEYRKALQILEREKKANTWKCWQQSESEEISLPKWAMSETV